MSYSANGNVEGLNPRRFAAPLDVTWLDDDRFTGSLNGTFTFTGLVESFRETIACYAEVGVTDLVVHWPRPDEPFAGEVATFERIIAAR